MDGWIEELLRGFRVETPDKFSGVFEVGKEHCNLLALTCKSGAGGEELVSEMGWRVGERRLALGWRRG
jgi:hypothetical protein